jgi:hypothetical protein
MKMQKASNCRINIQVNSLKSSSLSIKVKAIIPIQTRTSIARPSFRKKKSNLEENKIPIIKNMQTRRKDENTRK